MVNTLKGKGVKIKINAKLYDLVFDFEAIKQIEDEFDDSIIRIQEQLPKLNVLVAMLYAGLKGYGGNLLSEDTVLPPISKLHELVQNALHIAYFGKLPSMTDEN